MCPSPKPSTLSWQNHRGAAASDLSNKLVTFQKHPTFKKGISQLTSVGSHCQTRLREYAFNVCWCGWNAEDPLKIGSQLSVSCVKRSAGRVVCEILETETETIKKTSQDRDRSRDFNIPVYRVRQIKVIPCRVLLITQQRIGIFNLKEHLLGHFSFTWSHLRIFAKLCCIITTCD